MMSNPKALSKMSLLVHAIAMTTAVTFIADNLNYSIARSPKPSSRQILIVRFPGAHSPFHPSEKVVGIERIQTTRSF
ncbi:hypothetical protein IQ249_14285 [Lusitaniella coriacea LEGE 07157]|uniref:Uncharacterized protein n=1 Tax=Lusitaniella coriacea LEGE 07157 TaxID=945747 RepID=A0A8J7DXG6_9CYAN|nr:hypothetical protein [Lusitaniella coriacea]MBE9117066.1 hypothetical protein [Lusitaniella coriacea LEGE 07157]